MAKKTRPKKPRTAYELLDLVAKHILEEPKRYYQGLWVTKTESVIEARMGAVPACGTMACRAGWIVALHDGLDSKAIASEMRRRSIWSLPVMERANAILGMSESDTERLFDGGAMPYWAARPGTKGYARLGAKGIRAFMRKHAAHLKARLLKGV